MSKPTNDQTTVVEAATGPTNSGYWTDTGRYDISWYNNPDTDTYGDGSAENPYKISTAEDLAGLSYLVYSGTGPVTDADYFFSGVYFEQTADIDLSAYYWQPIGINYDRSGSRSYSYFSGNYDGGGHTVSGVFTPAGSSRAYSYQGLFGYVESSSSSYPITIQNICITDSFIQGYQYVGGVVGRASDTTTITNCYNAGDVTGSDRYVGGVVGRAYTSSSSYVAAITITNCYNTGDVTGTGDYVGGVAGIAQGHTIITNCYNTGSVTCTSTSYSYIGGVVGSTDSYTTITNCYNTGDVTGSDLYVGGVVGYAYYTTITNCYNTGSVSGPSRVGGIAGYAYYTTITNCYNTGDVTGTGERVGGVVGFADANTTITNCYNTGSVEGSSEVGGVVGYADIDTGAITITNCYYGGNCLEIVGGINGQNVLDQAEYSSTLTTETPKDLSWYMTEDNWNLLYPWDFRMVWKFDSSVSEYPVLRAEGEVSWWIDERYYSIDWYENPGTNDGSSASTPYIIDSAADLAGLSYLVYSGSGPHSSDEYFFAGKYFKQTADIDLTGHYWQPIGIFYDYYGSFPVYNYFSGNYDGGGHTVSGVFTPAGQGIKSSYQGLFGSVCASSSPITIQNVGVIDSHIQGFSYVGGVVGYAQDTTITNCYNTGSVTSAGTGDYVGGVVGYYYSSSTTITIKNCYNTGDVTGTSMSSSYVGGVVGYASTSSSGGTMTITNCYNIGSVSGYSYIGGVVGYAYIESRSDGTMIITNCYNTGGVSGSSRVGGVVGYASDQTSYNGGMTITNCYNMGDVTGTGNYVGGVVGFADGVTIRNCYYGVNCSYIVGGINGQNLTGEAERSWDLTANSPKELAWYTTASNNWDSEYPWDFKNVWVLDAGRNDGYPSFIIDYWISDPSYYSIEWFNNPDTETYGDGSESNPYIIDSAEDLAGLSWLVYTGDSRAPKETAYVLDDNYNSFFYNKHFKLASDINLAAHMWQPIGIMNDSANNCFGGIFDGNGHTIKGVFTLEENGSMQSVFGTTYSPDESYPSSIQNLMVTNSVIKGTSCVGGILGYAFFNSQIINCKFSGEIYGSAGSIGGIVGEITDCLISGCVNNGTVTNAASAGSDYIPIGGIVGYANTASTGAKIEYSANYGKVIGKNTAGGIVGHNMSAEIYYCTNNGDVSSSDSSDNGSVGGIVGRIKSTAKISLSQNNGKISGYNYVGGIIGISESNIDTESNIGILEIYSCINNGAIIGTGGSIGGIAGQTCMTNLKLCINYGDVTALSNFGGIVGQLVGQGAIKYCYAEFKLTQTKEHCAGGGIVGLINHNSATGPDAFEITNCYVDVTMSLITSDEVGAILGVDYSKGTYQPVVIEKCAAFVNGENVAARLLGGAREGSKLTFNLCYGVFNGSSKIIEGENFDGDFAYLEGFHEGRPIPLGIFHILDFGTKTGIVNQINTLK